MNEWNDLNPDELLSLMEEIQEENEELQEEKKKLREENSLQQQQISGLSSEVLMLKNAMKEMQQKHQSERQEMASVIAGQKEEISSLQKDNQSLQQSNDDLRNNAGILTRAEVKEVLNYNDELQDRCYRLEKVNANLQSQVNMSSVQAVEEANHRLYMAQRDAEKTQNEKQETIKQVEEERGRMEQKIRESLHREYISYGLVAALLFAASVYHPGIWNDLRQLLEPAADWISKMWIGALLRPDEWSQVWRWVCLLLLPVLVIAVAFGMYYLLARIWERKSSLTVVLAEMSLGGIIFFGEYYPGNSMLLLVEAIAIIVLSKCAYELHERSLKRIVNGQMV